MMSLRARKLLFICLCISGIYTSAQEPLLYNNETRLSLESKIKLKKRLSLNLSLESRSAGILNEFNSGIVSTSLRYKIKKTNYKIGVGYRHQYKLDVSENRWETRISWDDKIVKRTYLGLGIKYQIDINATGTTQYNFRPKIDLTHKIKKTNWYPEISVEPMHKVKYNGSGWMTIRFGIGFEYKINKKNSFELVYQKEWDDLSSDIQKSSLLQLAYKIDI